jgi:uncharacterized tellurite resistance protein B-like protein
VKDILKHLFGTGSDDDRSLSPRKPDDIRVATCALFLEMANIDDEFTESERRCVLEMLQQEYGVSSDHAAQLARQAQDQLEGSIDLWQFTNLINERYTKEEKIQVVELIWKLIYADGHLSEHENYLIHRLAKMLRLNHRELINAKLAVIHEEDPE